MTTRAGKIDIAVLISGRGSNLQSLIDACASDDFPARISVVLSNKADAYGLVRAQTAGIPTHVISHKDFADRESFERAMLECLSAHPVDLICQAGFMRILTSTFISPWRGRLINIHPSLLPKFKGLHTHERAIEAGEAEAGCTIHFVNEGVDEGEIILQRSVPIMSGDTPDILAERVLEQEHIAYPEAVQKLAADILSSR